MAYWIFQTNNPGFQWDFSTNSSLKKATRTKWMARRYGSEMNIGDGVLIWISGRNAGIYKDAEITEEPIVLRNAPGIQKLVEELKESNKTSNPFIANLEKFAEINEKMIDQINRSKIYNLELSLKDNFDQTPLLKENIKSDPLLSSLRIIQDPRQTVYKITNEEWERVHDLIRP